MWYILNMDTQIQKHTVVLQNYQLPDLKDISSNNSWTCEHRYILNFLQSNKRKKIGLKWNERKKFSSFEGTMLLYLFKYKNVINKMKELSSRKIYMCCFWKFANPRKHLALCLVHGFLWLIFGSSKIILWPVEIYQDLFLRYFSLSGGFFGWNQRWAFKGFLS
jgi:hypothetical protein